MTVAAIEDHQLAPVTGALAIRPGQDMWTQKQQAALAAMGIKDASRADLAVFMHYCQKTQLDPFSRQIYMIGRREKRDGAWVVKQTIQVGIDGFRVIRDRVAARLGVTVEYEDTIWYDADGSAHTVWLWEHAPAACNVTVVKDGKRFPGVVRTAAYAATNKDGEMIAQWRTQPDHMIEKCAEAFALRRAFPNDLGGIYLDDETPPPPADAPAARPARVTGAEIVGTPPDASPAAPQSRAAETAPEPPPPGSAAGEAPTGDRPPAHASSGQVSRISREFERLGYDLTGPDDEKAMLRRAARLARVGDITALNQLTEAQAKDVLDAVSKVGDVVELDELLETGESDG